MKTPKEKLKFIEVSIAALLKLHKFKKKGLIWRRDHGGVIDIVDIQNSRWNTADKINFFINLGICDVKKDLYEEKLQKSEEQGYVYSTVCFSFL